MGKHLLIVQKSFKTVNLRTAHDFSAELLKYALFGSKYAKICASKFSVRSRDMQPKYCSDVGGEAF